MSKPRGFIFYRGFSPVDGAPIVGIAVLKSKNTKTGNMIQTYILRVDVHPIDVSKSVSAVYKAFLRGSYPDYSHDPSLGAELLPWPHG